MGGYFTSGGVYEEGEVEGFVDRDAAVLEDGIGGDGFFVAAFAAAAAMWLVAIEVVVAGTFAALVAIFPFEGGEESEAAFFVRVCFAELFEVYGGG